MLTKQLIKEIAGTTIYNRGLELFKQNKVLTFKSNSQNHRQSHRTGQRQKEI